MLGSNPSADRLKMRHFLVFAYPEEVRMALRGPPGVTRERQDEEDGFNGARWV